MVFKLQTFLNRDSGPAMVQILVNLRLGYCYMPSVELPLRLAQKPQMVLNDFARLLDEATHNSIDEAIAQALYLLLGQVSGFVTFPPP